MVGSEAELGHREDVKLKDVVINSVSYDLLQCLLCIFVEADWAVGLRDTVVQFLRLVKDYYHCLIP